MLLCADVSTQLKMNSMGLVRESFSVCIFSILISVDRCAKKPWTTWKCQQCTFWYTILVLTKYYNTNWMLQLFGSKFAKSMSLNFNKYFMSIHIEPMILASSDVVTFSILGDCLEFQLKSISIWEKKIAEEISEFKWSRHLPHIF